MENFEGLQHEPESEFSSIKDEILDMAKRDQEVRVRAGEISDENERFENGKQMDEIDHSNTARMKEIIEEHGWPTISKVGEQASTNAWLLVQHADADPEFQAHVLEMLKQHMEEGEVSPFTVAMLTDRVAVNFGKPQVFGTQWWPGESGEGEMRPTENMDTLDERRAQYGLSPMTEYAKRMRANWDNEIKKWGKEKE